MGWGSVAEQTKGSAVYGQMAYKFKVLTVTLRVPYKDMNDPRVADLFQIREFFENWREDLEKQYPDDWKRRFVTMELYNDVVATIDGFVGMLDYASRNGLGPVDFRQCTQNCTEGSFSLSRARQGMQPFFKANTKRLI